MALFNFLPIYSLDGYRIVKLFLEKYFDDTYVIDLLFYVSVLFFTIVLVFSIIFKTYFLIVIVLTLTFKMFLEKRRTKQILHLKKLSKFMIINK